MKFAIYGAGKRGKEELEVLGEKNVVAFVDQDRKKIGTKYCNLPVIDIEELKRISKWVLCVITPASGREDIIKVFKHMEIENYVEIKAFDRVLYYEKEAMFQYICKKYDTNDIGIYGISAGSLLLYEFLLEKIKGRVFLIKDKSDLKNIIQQVQIIISTVLYLDEDTEHLINEKVKLLSFQNFFESNVTFYNKQIVQYRDIHKKQRCFIVATGPSLSVQDLNILHAHDEKCISMNRIYNVFSKTNWRPDYYLIEDTKMIEDLSKEIANMNVPVKFLPSIPDQYWQQVDIGNSIKYQLVILDNGNDIPLFSSKPERCIYEGSTVTYACIQMAAYMGFQEIYLLGVDFNYSNNLYDEKNHFEGYQMDKMVRLNTVHLERMEAAYISAREYAKKHGINIYNATRGGRLEVFRRVDFDQLFLEI